MFLMWADVGDDENEAGKVIDVEENQTSLAQKNKHSPAGPNPSTCQQNQVCNSAWNLFAIPHNLANKPEEKAVLPTHKSVRKEKF